MEAGIWFTSMYTNFSNRESNSFNSFISKYKEYTYEDISESKINIKIVKNSRKQKKPLFIWNSFICT